MSSPKFYAQTARELEITESNIYQWISQQKDNAAKSPKLKEDIDLISENRRLQQEILHLKKEQEILKKAAKFFANKTK